MGLSIMLHARRWPHWSGAGFSGNVSIQLCSSPPPTHSFSTATSRLGSGPQQLRSWRCPEGRPDLAGPAAAAVDKANERVTFIVSVLRDLWRMERPAVLIHPYHAFLWKMPSMRTAVRNRLATVCRTSSCVWGTPFRFQLCVALWGADGCALNRSCRTASLCQRTRAPRAPLPSKPFLERCPNELCAAVLLTVANANAVHKLRIVTALLDGGTA